MTASAIESTAAAQFRTDQTWHKSHSDKIQSAQTREANASADLARLWWELGRKLNQTYGCTTGIRGDGSEGSIPAADKVELCSLYQIGISTLGSARSFHRLAQTAEAAEMVILEYRNWSAIANHFVPGRTVQEAVAKEQERGDARQRARVQQKAETDRLRSQVHMNNVPDELVVAVENELGGPGHYSEACEAIRHFVATRVDAKSVAQVWKKRHG